MNLWRQQFSWNKFTSSLFIVAFLTFAVLTFALQREYWPFSRFGMYSEYFAGAEKCIFEVKFKYRFPDGEYFARPNDVEFLVNRLYTAKETDCGKLLINRGEPHKGFFKNLMAPAVKYALEEERNNNIQDIDVIVQLSHWNKWSAQNARNPDVSLIVYEEKFALDN